MAYNLCVYVCVDTFANSKAFKLQGATKKKHNLLVSARSGCKGSKCYCILILKQFASRAQKS